MRFSKAVNVSMHVVGWALLTTLMAGFLSISNRFTDAGQTAYINEGAIIFLLLFVVLFYANTYLLVPRLFLQKKYVAYWSIFVLLIAAAYFFKPFDALVMNQRLLPDEGPSSMDGPFRPPPANRPRPPRRGPHTDVISIILTVMVWALSMALVLVKQWRITERRAVQAEADKANAELSFLKAQINPHFLFNTLNNIYAMAVAQHPATAPSVMKLSQIMRYITEGATQDQVPLLTAVACLTDYIDLHRLRFNQKVKVDYSITGPLEGKEISPLILLTFVENIFKYGISGHEESPVEIKLDVIGDSLHFYCRNRVFTQLSQTQSTGIGIDNTRQRLQHLYPGKHHLQIQQRDGWFTVVLEITY